MGEREREREREAKSLGKAVVVDGFPTMVEGGGGLVRVKWIVESFARPDCTVSLVTGAACHSLFQARNADDAGGGGKEWRTRVLQRTWQFRSREVESGVL